MDDQDLKKAVRESYSHVAKNAGSCGSSSCCGSAKPQSISKKIGYSEEQIKDVPVGSNLGLGCGNPIAFASLKEGETVLDLGSGAGFDCFLASKIVGPQGKVIGVDMTAEMVSRAEANANQGGYTNVEFRLGEIEALPVEDNTIDVIISNCVINLVPDKKKAFQEAFRVLKPGGRLMVSDIVLLKGLPESVRQSINAYVGCIAGAMRKDMYLDAIRSAGFEDVSVLQESIFPLDCMTNDPTGQAILKSLDGSVEDKARVESCIASVKVRGHKLPL